MSLSLSLPQIVPIEKRAAYQSDHGRCVKGPAYVYEDPMRNAYAHNPMMANATCLICLTCDCVLATSDAEGRVIINVATMAAHLKHHLASTVDLSEILIHNPTDAEAVIELTYVRLTDLQLKKALITAETQKS